MSESEGRTEMATRRCLSRADGRPKAPVRIVHLGLGNFCRAHLAWYTQHASDAREWGIAAFAGRSNTHVADLESQGDVYTLLIQGPQVAAEIISSLSAVHAAADLAAWRAYFADPAVSLVTSTITEGGYVRNAAGDLDLGVPAVQADVAALRADPRSGVVTTAPGKFVAGLLARRAAAAGPLTFVPCDNVVGSGAMVEQVVRQMAAAVDPTLIAWIDAEVGVVSTMVDRITPGPGVADVAAALALTGYHDPATVITEPFTEWVLQGEFRSPRPAWESAGAVFTDDIEPFEHRKLWLLNGAHSLMAYAGPLREHTTVQEAIVDPVIRGWVDAWWDEASPRLPLAAADTAAYCAALLARFTNPAMRDVLSRIAADGSQKLPIRIVPTVLADLAAGRDPRAGLRAIAAWAWHVRGRSTPITDARQAEVEALGVGSPADSAWAVAAYLKLPPAVVPVVVDLMAELVPVP